MAQSIYVDGLVHGDNPIPAAAVVGSLLMSGGVSGTDRSTGTLPEDIRAEIAGMFDNVGAILDAAGGQWDQVVRIDVALTDPSLRAAVNDEWVRRFPDPARRPARKTDAGATLPGGFRVQCTFVANLDS